MCGKSDKGATCLGDSGGPLICEEDDKAVLHGVTSFGQFSNCLESEIGFFFNVSYALHFIIGVLVRINLQLWLFAYVRLLDENEVTLRG